MCIFNYPVQEVNSTRIFVCQACDGRQLTCYQNVVQESHVGKHRIKKNAMILPFPIGKGGGESKEVLEFVDLSKCPNILENMEDAFPRLEEQKQPWTFALADDSYGRHYLAIQKVGSYTCSVARSIADLRHINPDVFQLTDKIDTLMSKHYPVGFGFVVCQMNDQAEGKQHPIAYVHNLIKDGQLFVPTRHEHGSGHQENIADWDHYIYSSNTTEVKEAGYTTEELAHVIPQVASGKVRRQSVLPHVLLGQLPVQVVQPTVFRRLRIKDQTQMQNGDLLFTFKPSSEKIEQLPQKPSMQQQQEPSQKTSVWSF